MTRERRQLIAPELYRKGLSQAETRLCIEFYDLSSNQVIAQRMGKSEQWTYELFMNVFRKLGAANRTQLFGILECMVRDELVRVNRISTSVSGLPALYKGDENGKDKV